MIVLSLFDGMSCGRLALDRANIPVEKYYASEIDKYAMYVTRSNYPDTVHLGDINNWKDWDIDWASIDIILAGSPCQGFSFIGRNRQFDDPRSALFWVFVDILAHVQRLNPSVQFLVENVAMNKQSEDVFTDTLKVPPVKVNSTTVSDQNRLRIYWVSWKLGEMPTRPHEGRLHLPGHLELAVKNKGIWVPRPLSTCLDANYSKGVDNHGQRTMVKDGEVYRKFTPEECELLQTVPLGYTKYVSNKQRYTMLGNGWTVEVVSNLLKYLPNALN